jgi:hypothetical protein
MPDEERNECIASRGCDARENGVAGAGEHEDLGFDTAFLQVLGHARRLRIRNQRVLVADDEEDRRRVLVDEHGGRRVGGALGVSAGEVLHDLGQDWRRLA